MGGRTVAPRTGTSPRYLVETDWLAAHLADPDLRILDCTVLRRPAPETAHLPPGFWERVSGRDAWAAGHIPGSAFADLLIDLSDTSARYRFTLPSAEQFAAAMGRLGVGEGTRVVCYDAAESMWAARVWWLLRAFGFDNAAVLNGGWKKWTLEGRPISTDPPAHLPARFVARPRPALIAAKDDVVAAIGRPGACLVNALSPELHRGEGPSPYGRPGRIPTSVNVAANQILDPTTGAYLPEAKLREIFGQAGATEAEQVITYCGGGIAASSDALILTLLGVDNVAVYDGSLWEWAGDPDLPLERG